MRIKKLYSEKNLILIIIFGFLLLQLIFYQPRDVTWDEAVYLGMAKHIASEGGLWEPLRPPIFPGIISVSEFLGIDSAVFSRIAVLLLSIGCLYLVYLVGKEIFDEKIGLAAMFILAFTPLFFGYSIMILTGIPSTFFALLAIYFFVKEKFAFSGFFSVIALLFRFPQGLVLAVLGILVLHRRNLKNIAEFCVGASPLIIYLMINQIVYGSAILPFQMGAAMIKGVFLWIYKQGILYYWIGLLKQNFLVIFSIPFFVIYFLKKKFDLKINLLIVLFALFAIYFTQHPHKEFRYALIFLPYLAILSAAGMFYLKSVFNKKSGRQTAALILAGLFVIFFFSAANGINSITKSFEQKGFDELKYYFEGREIEGVVLTSDPRIVMFVDNKVIPLYYSFEIMEEIYAENREEAGAVVYIEYNFPCREGDEYCNGLKKSFFDRLNNELDLDFDKEGVYIFTS